MIPGGVNPMLLSAGGSSGYQLQRSLRLRASASAFLNRTPATAANRRTFTWSGWVKRGALGQQRLLAAYSGDENNTTELGFDATNNIIVSNVIGGTQATGFYGQTSGVFRDPSAWYHIVFSIDTTQATAVNALRVFVNGVLQTFGTSSYGGGINHNTWINNTNVHRIGQTSPPNNSFFDGYLSDVHFIDGQALTPSAFGQFDADGMWQAKPYSGTYGTNGFRLDFSDNTSTTTLMLDRSGNGNNWTANNISLTAGATYDSMLDVPLGGGGGERGNYATLNPLIQNAVSSAGAADGNLKGVRSSGGWARVIGTQPMSSGKWYWESTVLVINSGHAVGVGRQLKTADFPGFESDSWCYLSSALKYNNSSSSAYGASFTTNDVIGVALDMDAGTLTFYKNGVSQGQAYSGISGDVYAQTGLSDSGTTAALNFGQRPFAYTPPTGFKALHTGNLPAPAIANPKLHFDVVTRLGTGSTYSLTGLQFQPDLLWSKNRVNTANHGIVDSVRGVGAKFLHSENTAVEDGLGASLTSFNADGYTAAVGSSNFSYLNTVSETYVNWLWKAGGAPVTNNAGSISAQVSANPVAGFSIVTYTGTGANATVGHGLGVAPKMVIVKARNLASQNWHVYHAAVDAAPATYVLGLNLTVARSPSSTAWNNTAPTSSVFSLGTDTSGNNNTTNYVAYCFAEIPGFSKIGSYTGNGSADGPFVHCGFRPRWLMVKRSDTAQDWVIIDTARDTYNVTGNYVFPNGSSAENGGSARSTSTDLDVTANGFKLRNNASSSGYTNTSGGTYIFIAFAEAPFQSSLAR